MAEIFGSAAFGSEAVGNLYVSGDLIIGGNLTITGNITLAGNLNITGDLTVGGQVILNNNNTPATPALTFLGNLDTGMYRTGANTIGFSAGGTLETQISSNHLSVTAPNTPTNPSYNFLTNTNTGMYRVTDDTIGFSAGGRQVIQIENPGLDLTIPILTVGASALGVLGGIRRLSREPANSWEDGNCGNSAFIVFTATDFVNYNNIATAGTATTFVAESGAGSGARNSPVVYNSGALGKTIASKLIPKGFIIAEGERCFIYSDIQQDVTIPQEMDVEVKAQIAAGQTIEAPISISTPVAGPTGPVTIQQGGGGWVGVGAGSVNRTAILTISLPLGGAATAAATGTGFNTVNVVVTPTNVNGFSSATGGVVAFKIPIKRI